MWTMVGGGIKTLEQSRRPMASVMPNRATWIKKSVDTFEPVDNSVVLDDGSKIGYEYLVVALGIRVNFDKVNIVGELWISTC